VKRLGIALMLSGIAVWVTAGYASATPDHTMVTICHRTAAYTNPYVQINVDPASADGDTGNDNGQGDHAVEHTGPVFDPSTMHQGDTWGDIIPPHDNFGGLNWDATGQAIYTDGCNVTPTSPPPTSPPPCEQTYQGCPTDSPTPPPTSPPPCEQTYQGCPTDSPTPPPTSPPPTSTPQPTQTPSPTETPSPSPGRPPHHDPLPGAANGSQGPPPHDLAFTGFDKSQLFGLILLLAGLGLLCIGLGRPRDGEQLRIG
jgi:hypothetical protein